MRRITMNRAPTLLTLAFAFIVLCGREAVDAAATPAAGAPPDTAPAPAEPGQVILIQNATGFTVSHGAIEHRSILIKDGKNAAVRPSVKTAAGAQVIEASGQFVVSRITCC